MKQSAGLLLFRQSKAGVQVLLVHPGGPIWGHQDIWSIPKGELDEGEDHLAAAEREFKEEVGMPPPKGERIELGTYRQPNKINHIWAIEGTVDLTQFHCEPFSMEWPPKSGNIQEFPENDKAEWFALSAAAAKVFKGQAVIFDRLAQHLGITIRLPEPPQQQLL